MQATSQAFVQAGCRAVLRTPGQSAACIFTGVRIHDRK
jgi:hypothetical protein